MEAIDFFKSGVGAIIGFVLAQLVNVAKLIWDWWNRPVLLVKPAGDDCLLLSHTTEVSSGELCKEKIYGFFVRNLGRRVATGVRVQLLKAEHRPRGATAFETVSEHSYDLALHHGSIRKSTDTETVLIPGASVEIELAGWREDYDVVFPTVSGLPEYYEEICSGSVEYRFTVVAFDENANFAQRVLTISLA